MDDLFGIVIFVVIAALSLLGRKKPKTGQTTQMRPGGVRPRPVPDRQAAQPLGAPARPPQGLGGFLELLQSQLEARVPEYEEQPEAVSLELSAPEEQPLDAASHKAFHDRYVEEELVAPVTRRHRYHLTPRTAREAAIWTAIFTKPKGLE